MKKKIILVALIGLLMAGGLIIVGCSEPCKCYKGDKTECKNYLTTCPATYFNSTQNCNCN